MQEILKNLENAELRERLGAFEQADAKEQKLFDHKKEQQERIAEMASSSRIPMKPSRTNPHVRRAVRRALTARG